MVRFIIVCVLVGCGLLLSPSWWAHAGEKDTSKAGTERKAKNEGEPEVLEISEENVKVRLHRARALLRKSLYALAGLERKEAFNFHALRCDRVVKNVFERIQQQMLKAENSAAETQ